MNKRLQLAALLLMALPLASAQQLTAPAAQTAVPQAAPAVQAPAQTAEYSIHGVVRSGGVPLPGVSITAQHSLTGRKVLTSTDVDGSFRLALPGKGRWVLRAELSAFAAQTAELVLTPAASGAAHDFELLLLSRTPKPANDSGEALATAAVPTVAHAGGSGNQRGAQRLSLSADDAALAQAAGSSDADSAGAGASGLASSADATNASLAVAGRMGNAQDLGVQTMDDLRDRINELRARGEVPGGGDFGGGGAGGGPFMMGGGPGGGGGGGRMRMGSLNKPHGQVYFTASNSALDAAPYTLSTSSASGAPAAKPSYGANRFGATVGGPVKIPHLYDDGGKTFAFLNYSGTRSTTPSDSFSHVPTALERNGDFSQTMVNGSAAELTQPTALSGCAFGANTLGNCAISSQANALLKFIPLPNITNGAEKNFRYSTAATSDQDIFSLRLTHNFGPASTQQPGAGGGRGGRSSNGTHNNMNFGINYQRSSSQTLENFPTTGGSAHSNGYNANLGWSIGKGKLSNQLRFTWNRSRAHSGSNLANQPDGDVPELAGITYPSGLSPMADKLNYGAPSLNFTNYAGLSDVSPSQSDAQTFSLSENFGWVRGKHHLHTGGDYRWIDNKSYASQNPRGSFTFISGKPLEAGYVGTGYDFADFLLGLPQTTSLAYSTVHDQYLSHSYDLFVQDDWRWRSNLTLNLGLRYEFISPFHEANGNLANMLVLFDGNGNFTGVTPASPASGGYGSTLMHAQHDNFAPRIGVAWKPWGNKTVIRAGYGINYNLRQYQSIVRNLAAQPPYSVAESNTQSTAGGTLTLQKGFASPPSQAAGPCTLSESCAVTNSYAVDPNYRVAYVQAWNLNIQRELTPALLLNVGYTGSKGSQLDMLRAPNRNASGLIADQGCAGGVGPCIESFNWETSQGSSILHAGSVRLRKRMTRGFSAGGTYTFAKSIDNASSIGGGAQVVAQDDKNLHAERGLSGFDQRHKLSADWSYELPWGDGRLWLKKPGAAQKLFGDWLLSSTIAAATGTPFTAHVLGAGAEVNAGANGSLRANATGQPIHGGGSIARWFNPGAFTSPPAGTYGSAGRNTIIGPGSWLMSLVLSKNFPIKEGMGLEARAEADNVLNHANYSAIDTTLGSPTYGQVTGVSSMRKMLLSVHYRF